MAFINSFNSSASIPVSKSWPPAANFRLILTLFWECNGKWLNEECFKMPLCKPDIVVLSDHMVSHATVQLHMYIYLQSSTPVWCLQGTWESSFFSLHDHNRILNSWTSHKVISILTELSTDEHRLVSGYKNKQSLEHWQQLAHALCHFLFNSCIQTAKTL